MDENENTNDSTQEAVSTAEKTAATDFNKDRQRADQAEANLRKASQEKTQMASALAQAQEALRNQQEQINALSEKKKAFDSIPDVDVENASIESLAQTLNAAKKLITDQAEKIASLENVKNRYANLSAEERAMAQKQQVLNEVCDDLEDEFGAGLRNDAIKLMKKINEEQGDPANSAQAVLRLRKCFKQVKEAKTAKDKKKNPVTTPGDGGGRASFGNRPQLKKGSLKEVMAQIRAGKN